MNYASQDDMVDLFGYQEVVELTNLENPGANTIDSVRLEKALDYASREVDSYLQATRYQLPLAVIPLVLRNKVGDIARYHLDSYRAREDVRQRYEDAIKWLQMLVQGKVNLGLDKLTEQQVNPSGGVHYYTQSRVFTQEFLSDYAG
jgi:phage gp36-like protein